MVSVTGPPCQFYRLAFEILNGSRVVLTGFFSQDALFPLRSKDPYLQPHLSLIIVKMWEEAKKGKRTTGLRGAADAPLKPGKRNGKEVKGS